MKDLSSPRIIKFKGTLFLLAGIAASVLLLMDAPSIRTAALLGVAVWCFCRAYYFAFYVIQHYVDPGYRYSGLWSFVLYMFTKSNSRKPPSS